MNRRIVYFLLCNLAASGAFAQSQTNRIPFVRAVGTGSVAIKPDQAMIDVGVVTQAATASDAASQNANQVTAVINALATLLGQNADIKTVNYSLTPNYNYPSGQTPVLTGYTANNTVRATTGDLTVIGRVIDTAVQSGANQVVALQFGLKNDAAARGQALQLATQQAKSNADAMAAGVQMHTGAVQVIQEASASTPLTYAPTSAASAPTPIQIGTLSIQANVTLDISLVQ